MYAWPKKLPDDCCPRIIIWSAIWEKTSCWGWVLVDVLLAFPAEFRRHSGKSWNFGPQSFRKHVWISVCGLGILYGDLTIKTSTEHQPECLPAILSKGTAAVVEGWHMSRNDGQNGKGVKRQSAGKMTTRQSQSSGGEAVAAVRRAKVDEQQWKWSSMASAVISFCCSCPFRPLLGVATADATAWAEAAAAAAAYVANFRTLMSDNDATFAMMMPSSPSDDISAYTSLFTLSNSAISPPCMHLFMSTTMKESQQLQTNRKDKNIEVIDFNWVAVANE